MEDKKLIAKNKKIEKYLLNLQNGDKKAYLYLGNLYYECDEFEKAIENYERAYSYGYTDCLENLPLIYSMAMVIDAFAAIIFGKLYDKFGIISLVIASLLSASFAVFIFAFNSLPLLMIGVAMWGIGMGAQESILKAVVTDLVPKYCRATGYGIFECSFGIFWFLGSTILGILYDTSITAMIIVSTSSQLIAIPFYIISYQRNKLISEQKNKKALKLEALMQIILNVFHLMYLNHYRARLFLH